MTDCCHVRHRTPAGASGVARLVCEGSADSDGVLDHITAPLDLTTYHPPRKLIAFLQQEYIVPGTGAIPNKEVPVSMCNGPAILSHVGEAVLKRKQGQGAVKQLTGEAVSRFVSPCCSGRFTTTDTVLFYESGKQMFPLMTSIVADAAVGIDTSRRRAVQVTSDMALHIATVLPAVKYEVVVPFVVHVGHIVQFGAVYLIPDTYPVPVLLSGKSDTDSPAGRGDVGAWLRVVSQLCAMLLDMLLDARLRGGCSEHVTSSVSLRTDYILKPVYNTSYAWFDVQSLFTKFQALYDCPEARQYVHFPAGVMGYPDATTQPELEKFVRFKLQQLDGMKGAVDYADSKYAPNHPIMLYDKLMGGEGWRRLDKCLHEDTLPVHARLMDAVAALEKAFVIHLDLRSPNVFYRRVKKGKSKSCVELKIIDWDDAQILNFPIGSKLYANMQCLPHIYPSGEKRATVAYHEMFVRNIRRDLGIVEVPVVEKKRKRTSAGK